ncbi:glycoside hydrolase family 88 protein [Motilibacter aurantiacus]|uniref:glycoside hydrolase family 88 protein n=1 Tax=Motilibacter aurantiacus TaxID=2714955 RepID=UPI001408E338|nr:glycoside hydrolase family 88 protein [Motilibacter aurantiacus]NHC45214.1 glucuronyl hydrolase [Motilibacter aurantiacus]
MTSRSRLLPLAVAAAALAGVLPASAAPVPARPTPARCAPAADTAQLQRQVRATLQLAGARLAAADAGPATRYPKAAYPGDRRWRRAAPGDWTAGFYPGALWLLADLEPGTAWRARARRWTAAMLPQAGSSSHDVGFMLGSSAGEGWRLTGDRAYRSAQQRAARSLARHFVPAVGANWSWAADDPSTVRVIVDSLMNLELLFEAGDARSRRLARRHARTLARTHVRPDGSTWHVVDLDRATGAVERRWSAQGYADSSTWARGQAWALHGLTTAWRETGDPVLRDTARRVADRWVADLPADCVPAWDVDDPRRAPKDASAAVVAVSGLLELSRLETDAARAARYRGSALATLAAVTTPAYTTARTGGPSVLRRQVYRSGSDVGAFIWGDYYLLQALVRLRDGRAGR